MVEHTAALAHEVPREISFNIQRAHSSQHDGQRWHIVISSLVKLHDHTMAATKSEFVHAGQNGNRKRESASLMPPFMRSS